MEFLRDEGLCFLARDEVDELLGIFHMFGILDDVNAIRLGNYAFLHVNQLHRRTIGYVFGATFFKGQAHSVFTIGYAFIHSRGTGQQFAIEILGQFFHIIPALVGVTFAHSIEHINQVLIGRRRFGRVSKGNLALECRIQQVFVAFHLHIPNEVRIYHDYAGNIREAGNRTFLILESLLHMVFIDGTIFLKQRGLWFHRA